MFPCVCHPPFGPTEQYTEQEQFLLRSPQLLTSLLAMTLSHNWLVPTLHVMHLHAYLAQALVPGSDELLQLPHVSPSMLSGLHNPSGTDELRKLLQDQGASYAEDLNRASLHLGKLEISDAYFKGSIVVISSTLKSHLMPNSAWRTHRDTWIHCSPGISSSCDTPSTLRRNRSSGLNRPKTSR